MTDVAVAAPSSDSRTLALVGWGACLFGLWPVGLGIALIDKKNAQGWVATHYSYMTRTVLLGLLFGGIVLAVSLVSSVLAFFAPVFLLLQTVTLFMPVILGWYFVRCVIGLVAAVRSEPLKRPRTWLF